MQHLQNFAVQAVYSSCNARHEHKVCCLQNVLQGNAADRAFGTRLLDVHMLGALNGAQRSIEHYHRLLRQTGLVMGKITYTRSPFTIVECLPV